MPVVAVECGIAWRHAHEIFEPRLRGMRWDVFFANRNSGLACPGASVFAVNRR